MQESRTGCPVGTLVVNLLGCLVIGVLMGWVERGVASAELRYFLGLGMLGAFTTFSFEALHLAQGRNWIGALLYVAASVGGCLVLITLEAADVLIYRKRVAGQ